MLPVIPVSVHKFSDYTVPLVFSKDGNPANSKVANFLTSYDERSRQYFIKDVIFAGQLTGIDCDSIPTALPVVPVDPFESACAQKSSTGFTFIRLRSRDSVSAQVSSGFNMGENPNADEIVIPNNYKNSVLFRQTIFPNHTFK